MQVRLSKANEEKLREMAALLSRSIAWCANSEITAARALRYMRKRKKIERQFNLSVQSEYHRQLQKSNSKLPKP